MRLISGAKKLAGLDSDVIQVKSHGEADCRSLSAESRVDYDGSMADLDAATLEPGVAGPSDELAQTLDGNLESSQAGRSPLLPVSQQVGRFVVLRLLGQGGTGTVYAAYDEKLDRKIAVKLVTNVSSDPKAHRDRVLREAQAMARISHPNVVQVFEVGELGTQVFIAMEFIDGVTLATWQRAAGRSWQEILQLYRAAGQGLWAAHQVGLIHRDFKADNVLIGNDLRPRVLDFGLARLRGVTAASPKETTVGDRPIALTTPQTIDEGIAGTPGYMSPENITL